jgi:hypothetical protein
MAYLKRGRELSQKRAPDIGHVVNANAMAVMAISDEV